MHMADALLSSAVSGGMYACSLVAAGYALRKVQQERNDKILPVMGVMGAFVLRYRCLTLPYREQAHRAICAAVCCWRLLSVLTLLFDDDRRAADSMPAVCGRRSAGAGR